MSPKTMNVQWYGVKGLFRWAFKSDGVTSSMEERVLLFQADSFDHAIELAKAEATHYCEDDPTANFFIEAVGWWHAYLIGEEAVQSGLEVYSRLSDTSLSGSSFLRRYYPNSHDHKSST